MHALSGQGDCRSMHGYSCNDCGYNMMVEVSMGIQWLSVSTVLMEIVPPVGYNVDHSHPTALLVACDKA